MVSVCIVYGTSYHMIGLSLSSICILFPHPPSSIPLHPTMRSKDLFGSGHLRRHPAVLKLKLLLVLVLGAANPAASIGLLSVRTCAVPKLSFCATKFEDEMRMCINMIDLRSCLLLLIHYFSTGDNPLRIDRPSNLFVIRRLSLQPTKSPPI